MHTAGIRELKDKLSHFVRLARNGERVLITDRGEVVATLGPPERNPHEDFPPGLVELARQGKAQLGGPNRSELYPKQRPVLRAGEALRLLDELRGER
ncbi:MAG TPA: type II toxin-antitoxin system prevent-host-death family antitoxin [Thermoanaerobaculia bacterium]|nr:type II toxin-antitoxin system prevent-host-death family antitoxin [Thermoanaerobaculia bacterium]